MNDQTQWGRAKFYLFRDLFEWWGPSVVEMQGRDKTLPPWRDNCEAMIALRRRANAEWEAITGLPPLGDPGKWYAAAMAATDYPLPKVQQMAVDELRAIVTTWALGRKASRTIIVDDSEWKTVEITVAAEHFRKTPKTIRDWAESRTPPPYRIKKARRGWVKIHPDDWKI